MQPAPAPAACALQGHPCQSAAAEPADCHEVMGQSRWEAPHNHAAPTGDPSRRDGGDQWRQRQRRGDLHYATTTALCTDKTPAPSLLALVFRVCAQKYVNSGPLAGSCSIAFATDHASDDACQSSSQRSASLRTALSSDLYSALMAATTWAAGAAMAVRAVEQRRHTDPTDQHVAIRGRAGGRMQMCTLNNSHNRRCDTNVQLDGSRLVLLPCSWPATKYDTQGGVQGQLASCQQLG